MEIYHFSNERDRQRIKDNFVTHFQKRDFVPFFGSGFTKGCPAHNGRVPSSEELKGFLIKMIIAINGYDEKSRQELEGMKLAKIASYFWQAMEHAEGSYQTIFYSYMEDHFTDVRDLSVEQRQLIECSWRYIYTLNYDDALENTSSNLICIVPFSLQNRPWLSNHRCLYKIHGDATQFLKTRDSRLCILSPSQYLTALQATENSNMLENLEADFSSNNLIFFGCSLLDELDLLFMSGTKLSQKKSQNKDTHSYYVRYMDEDAQPLTPLQEKEYEQFSITDIIEVNTEDVSEFYSMIANASEIASQLREGDNLSPFMGFSFVQLDSYDHAKNIKHLFYSSEIQPQEKTKQITLPSFFVRRQIGANIIADIDNQHGNLHILRGNRISGKTYILIDILRYFRSKSIYYFRSGTLIADELLLKLITMKKAILLFDEHTLTPEQSNHLARQWLHILEENQCHAVLAIDRSTGSFTRHYFESYPDLKNRVIIYHLQREIENSSDCQTFENFSKEVGKLGLPSPKFGDTFLDYILKIDEISFEQHPSVLPNINIFFGPEQNNKLKALLLFTNQESIAISQANVMGVDVALYNLCATSGVDMVVQRDFLEEAELASNAHSRFRFLVNSKYWVYQCLSAFASNKANYPIIANAYYDIVKTIQKQYHFDTAKIISNNYFQEVKPYYFLDTIQFTFFGLSKHGGSLILPEMIYEKLLPLFRDDYQYLHQKAKCLLWNSKKEKEEHMRQDTLNKALQIITRAHELASKSNSQNIHYTLYHMQVTKTIILVNHWCHCRFLLSDDKQHTHLNNILQALYQMELEMSTYYDDTEDSFQKNNMKDINWFIQDLASGDTHRMLSPSDRSLATNIINLARQNKGLIS